MLTEAEAIPYEPALLRGERLLVLAPHPDDEVIGCGGLVALHLRERRAVRIVIATDGAEAGAAALREQESRRGVERLGSSVPRVPRSSSGSSEGMEPENPSPPRNSEELRGTEELVFLRFPDRALGEDAGPRLRDELLAFRPDLILVPSPVEIHPDHLALSRLFCELVQQDETLFADLALARVAFYEVSQPFRPNAIVDISEVAEAKYAAIGEHASQTAVRDYVGYARGLNAYRAMTLPAEAKFAEAYFVVELAKLRTTPLSELRRMTGAGREAGTTGETLPVSVVVRTKNRPALLREAIESIRATGYPCEIVVVNDGGTTPELEGVKLVEHESSRGRSEAANAGVRAASNAYIAFLDDDDLYYPEHLATLANAAGVSNAGGHAGWYTDAISAFLQPGESGAYETRSRMRLFAQDYDPDLLLLDNYIPLPALLVPRETFLDADGFDPAFDLFEDWDFLIRLSQRGSLLRIPRLTCEIRHFAGGSSVVLAAPEGSEAFRKAKLQVWSKHAALIDNNVIANVFERQKRRTNALYSDAVEAKGQLDETRLGVERMVREGADAQYLMNGYALRVRELEGALGSLQLLVPRLENENVLQSAEIERITRDNADLLAATNAANEEIGRLRVEIARLNGLLEMIYGSKTWKLHTMVEKARGRG